MLLRNFDKAATKSLPEVVSNLRFRSNESGWVDCQSLGVRVASLGVHGEINAFGWVVD